MFCLSSAIAIALLAPPASHGIDPRQIPATYSLSRDPGFTPWSSFLSLGHDRLGEWTLEGSSLGMGLRCLHVGQGGCQPLAFAIAAPVWQPKGSHVGVFAGPSLSSLPVGGRMRPAPGFSAGIRITSESLAALVRRGRGRAAR